MNFRLLYPKFKRKAFTFSYDDGIIHDKTMIEIFNKYDVKATFNLNYAKSKEIKYRLNKDGKEIDCSYLDLDKDFHIYDGFEIASHSFTHPHMENIDNAKQKEEMLKNKEALEKLFNKKIDAFCYPYGTYNEDTIKLEKELGITYSRTTRSTYDFYLPYNFLMWNPTIHHRDKKIFDVINRFKNDDRELSLLYIWGHSYEFAIDDNFYLLEDIIKKINEDKEAISLSNGEIYDYVNDAAMLYYRDNRFVNPSKSDIYVEVNNQKLLVKSKGVLDYEE